MTLTFLDLVNHTPFLPCSASDIPHEQGFYLIFDSQGEFVYVGKGWLDVRVKIHFDPTEKKEYYPEACFWCFFETEDEAQALAYELAVYDYHLAETGLPPKRNDKRPPGAATPISRRLDVSTLQDYLAKRDWKAFLRAIHIKRLVSRFY